MLSSKETQGGDGYTYHNVVPSASSERSPKSSSGANPPGDSDEVVKKPRSRSKARAAKVLTTNEQGLPEFKDAEIETRVFTHRSKYARPNHQFEDTPDNMSPDNERLEQLGDVVLNLVVTEFIQDKYPGLRVGPVVKIRQKVVANHTLAKLTKHLNLHHKLLMHPSQAVTLRASLNVQADLFEAFVGGIYLDQGLEAVKRWLWTLLQPCIEESYEEVRKEHRLPASSASPFGHRTSSHAAGSVISSPGRLQTGPSSPAPPTPSPSRAHPRATSSYAPSVASSSTSPHTPVGHLGLFNTIVQQKSIGVEWMIEEAEGSTKTTPMWDARCYHEGELIGQGVGSAKKVAMNEAARQVRQIPWF
ncbi:ribonuclease III [Sistotremastrum niveocremeum HHB9708]|uniref:Ribonuclease III n=1 Tax=Sistotremastrum niveocremeum HHB9708 TaxID=1314777 RepID=A0A164ZKZ0_9AGAM|nr:ribonuclease III [Sistotremastrum niveocremeum HHB9708]